MKVEEKKTRKAKDDIKEIFCASNGHLSSKRILGSIVIIAVLVATIIESTKEGITDNIKDLYEVFIITGTSLLGITSVTNIFTAKYSQPKKEKETQE